MENRISNPLTYLQEYLKCPDFKDLLSWWGLFVDVSCQVGEGLNYFKVWVYLHLIYGGEMVLSTVA